MVAFENVDIAGNLKSASKGGRKEKESSLMAISLKPDLILEERGVVGGFKVVGGSVDAASSASMVALPEWPVCIFLL